MDHRGGHNGENRVLISGYYGHKNVGDDALLSASAWSAQGILEARQIFVTADNIPRSPWSGPLKPIYRAKQLIRGENMMRAACAAVASQRIIFGGGSVFHSSPVISDYLRLLRFSRRRGHAAVGVGLGPFRNSEAEKLCAELLHRLEFAGFRDKESYELASAIAPGANIAKTFDLAPLLFPAARAAGRVPEKPGERKGLGLILCDYERFVNGNMANEQTRRDKIVQLLGKVDLAAIEEIVFIDFNGHPYFGDTPIHRDISMRIGNNLRVRHMGYSEDTLGVLKVVGGLKALISMRLHGAIFGYLMDTPTIMLSYHPKCRGWAAEVGMNQEAVFDSVDFDVDCLNDAVMKSLKNKLGKGMLPIQEAERLALENWSWISESG